MSEPTPPDPNVPNLPYEPRPVAAPAVRPAAPPPRPPQRSGSLLGVAFGMSFLINIFLVFLLTGIIILVILIGASSDSSADNRVIEEHHSGKQGARDKIAIITIDGVLLDGRTSFIERQIETAAKDTQVKAVVVRIDSPGGSITASDDIHHRLSALQKGTATRTGKKVVVSMGAMAASGGYYVAMPSDVIYAERTTITGSIGVFVTMPNVKGLCDRYGVKVDVIKKGEVKDSGSPFKEMTPQERQVWQDLVDNAYDQFVQVIEQGRPKLKGKMAEEVINRKIPVTKEEPDGKTIQTEETYVRQRADGGVFTADRALEFGLIDKIGYLDDAVLEAKQLAGLGEEYRVVRYQRILTLAEILLGVKTPEKPVALDPSALAGSATPRLWYLAPQSEVAGLLSTVGQ